MTTHSKIYIAGHRGMVGSAVWRALTAEGYTNIMGRTSKELDLRNQQHVLDFINTERPDIIIDAAARVGGILANSLSPYPFLMENLQIQNNLIDAAHKAETAKFVFLGSSCIYPKFAPQPLKEEHLLTDSLEPTNQWYAIAKIAGVKACEAIREQYGKDFVSLMPTNLYGPNDNFDLETSHVLPAMMRKFHESKSSGEPVKLWGSGTPMREFLHVDDLAQGVLFAVKNKLPDYLYNVGTGTDVTIKTLAETIQNTVGHKGVIEWDTTKPDGTPRKLMDSSKLRSLGWAPAFDLESGIKHTYDWFISHQDNYKAISLS
ncbi:GDP-L-fucose synthase family protein [Psychroserpens sp.]|uniref:GDP-L-fucose synthase family protein n=1 Tax=Psychroserpens sp. TaxID=2020870 RepID=UPI003C727A8D